MNALRTLYQLAWQPGLLMTQAWWDFFNLTPWKACYQKHHSARQHIDQEIINQRNFPQNSTLPHELNNTDTRFIETLDTLPKRLCAIGLWRFRHHEYFILHRYRHALIDYLGLSALNQIHNLRPHTVPTSFLLTEPLYPPEDLVKQAIKAGTQLIPLLAVSPCVYQASTILLPDVIEPLPTTPPNTTETAYFTRHCFTQLERWL